MPKFKCFVLSLLVTAAVPAATILVNPNPIVSTNAVKDAITGADMAGLIVTATYNTPGSPTTVTGTWMVTGLTSGKATLSTTVVSLTGDTSDSLAWQYTSSFLSPLLSLSFDGTAAEIYFDRSHTGPGTPGTGPGADIVFGPLLSPPPITVTYSSAVALDGNEPVGDLYAKMEIDFSSPGLAPQDFAFTQDTDLAIPEPASPLLLLSGIGLLACALRSSASPNTENSLLTRPPDPRASGPAPQSSA